MGTKIVINRFNTKSFKKAAEAVRQYAETLDRKIETFNQRLIEIGLETALARINASPVGYYIHIEVKNEPLPFGAKAVLIATGDMIHGANGDSINALLMTEFGTGIKFNKPGNPKADEFGMGPGTYGKGHGLDPKGWWYLDHDNKWKHSYGMKATMPMYATDMEILQNIHHIAEEVFTTNKVIQC